MDNTVLSGHYKLQALSLKKNVAFLVGMGSRAMDDAAEAVGNHSKHISAAFSSVNYFSLLFSCFQPH